MAPEKYAEKSALPSEKGIMITKSDLRLYIAAAMMEIESDALTDDQLALAAAMIEKRLEDAFWGDYPFEAGLLQKLQESYLDNE